jgi:hypothetical protein
LRTRCAALLACYAYTAADTGRLFQSLSLLLTVPWGQWIHSPFLHYGDNPIDLLVDREQKVEDDLPPSSHLGYYCHRGDLEVCWQATLELLPGEHLAKASLDLILDVFDEESNQLRGLGRGMRAAFNRCLNHTPISIQATINGGALLPLPKGGREWVYLSQRLELH